MAGEPRWGEQTALAVQNFPISGEPMHQEVIRAIVLVKAEAAAVNARHGLVEDDVATAIRTVCAEVLRGAWRDQFPVDVFQTGSGTSSNMNVNEVIASRATELLGRPVHPNDHVNASQSSNDVIPTAIRLAVGLGITRDLLPALAQLQATLESRSAEHASTVKLGRTHLMDAAPLTFGQELGGWARMVHLGSRRLDDALSRVSELPIGGTAVGTGLNAPVGFGREVAERISARTGLPVREAVNHFEAQSTQDALLDASAACRSVGLSMHKIAGDLRLLGSGPFGGLGELRLPELQQGSSIMPGKVNPVIPEVVQQVAAQVVGNDAAIAFSLTASMLQLNTAMPVIARCLLSSVRLLTSAATVLDEKCLRSVTVDEGRMRRQAERSASITMALVPRIGYDAAARVARTMVRDDVPLADALHAEGVSVDAVTDLVALTRPGVPG